MSDLWVTASTDVEAQEAQHRFALAKVACADFWPFLAAAQSRAEYDSRKALASDRIAAAVGEAAPIGTATHDVLRREVEAGLDADWQALYDRRLPDRMAEVSHRIEAALKAQAKAARDLAVGDKISQGTVSKVDATTTPGTVYVWVNGKTDPPADVTYSHGDPVTVSDASDTSKDASRTAVKIGDMVAYQTTCPNPQCENHGTAFVHDDLAGDDASDDEEARCPDCDTPLVAEGQTTSRLDPSRAGQARTAGHEVEITDDRRCDICKHEENKDTPAEYDARLTNHPQARGSWANVCQRHFDMYGPGKTGTGFAQKFKRKSAKTASISVTNVGTTEDPLVFKGTNPSGNGLLFRVTQAEAEQLRGVLFSALAINFSGVTIDEGDIVTTGAKIAADFDTCPKCGKDEGQYVYREGDSPDEIVECKACGHKEKLHDDDVKKAANAAQDSCEQCKKSPGYHAGLHVGHVWTNTSCPAYRTQDGSDCTCDKKESAKVWPSKLAASQWQFTCLDCGNKFSRDNREGETFCPQCKSDHLSAPEDKTASLTSHRTAASGTPTGERLTGASVMQLLAMTTDDDIFAAEAELQALAASFPAMVAGEGAQLRDPHNSGLKKEVPAGTVATPGQQYATMFGRHCDYKVEGEDGEWQLSGAWTAQAEGSRVAAGPDWLRERNNDPYGTPPNHAFWNDANAEDINGFKVFERDGKWYAHHITKNYWMTLSATDAASARAEVEGMNTNLDMWASRRTASPEGWWPLAPAPTVPGETQMFPGEQMISCPRCGSIRVLQEGSPPPTGTGAGGVGRAGDPGYGTLLKCQNCGNSQRFSSLAPPPFARSATRIDTLRTIVEQHVNPKFDGDRVDNKIDGMYVDPTTANMLVTVYDALKPENQARFDDLPLGQLVDFGWKHVSTRKQADLATSRPLGWEGPLPKPPDVDFGSVWGGDDVHFITPEGPVWAFRKGQHVRFYNHEGKQIGPEQGNVAPAWAYAASEGWYSPGYEDIQWVGPSR